MLKKYLIRGIPPPKKNYLDIDNRFYINIYYKYYTIILKTGKYHK